MVIWRRFESEQEFIDWHEQAKALIGMPIIGVRASDGEPRPGNRQTTEYTELTAREPSSVTPADDNATIEGPKLDAVVASEPIIHYVSVLVRADMMLPEELAALANVYPAWQAGEAVAVDDLRSHGGMLWRAVQAHTTQADWQPDVAVSLWVRAAPPDVIPEWRQPLGAHDAYPVGYVVTRNGDLYESLVAANVWEPGTDPTLWALIGGGSTEPEIPDWKPWDGHNASLYQIGDEVMHKGTHWRATVGNNHWEPGVFGWAAV
jgi:hypothetical protein